MTRSPTPEERELARRDAERARKGRERAARRAREDELPDLRALLARPAFFDRAACRGKPARLFYGPFVMGQGHQETSAKRDKREAHAKAVCADCPVIAECRNHARYHREQGVWGGETEKERARAGYYDPVSVAGSKAARRARTAAG